MEATVSRPSRAGKVRWWTAGLLDLLTTWAVGFSFPQRADILDELQKSQKVFAEKLNHLSRRLAWINATVYSKVG